MIVRLLHIALLLMLFLPSEAQREWHKMSPRVKAKSVAKGRGRVYAFVKTTADAEDLYRENGCTVYATFGDIQIVSIPQERLTCVAQDGRVVRIEMGSPMEPTNALSSSILGVKSVHEAKNLPRAYSGSGVVVGVQDIGFDLTNPNFYSHDMSRYRIGALWDMLDTDTVGSLLPMGRDYTTEEELLRLGHSRDGLTECHGSHTLGTATGSGYNSIYGGMAPDADICLVANVTTSNRELLAEDDDTEYGSVMTALGFKYIFDYADAVGKPCVISFSEGSYQGFEEEDLLFYDVLERMTSAGHIIVASAGNSSTNASYIHKWEGQERAGSFVTKYENQLYFVVQGTNDFATRVTIHAAETGVEEMDTRYLREYTDSVVCDTIVVDGREYDFMMVAYPSAYDESRMVVECLIDGPDKIGYDSTGPISVELLGMDADVELYSLVGNLVENAIDPTLSDGETSHNVHSPSSAPAVISVGATAYATGFTNMMGDSLVYDYGRDGVRASFSSIGPTVDNRTKPDVMAPGTNIYSSTNSFYFEANPDATNWSDLVESYEYGGRTYYWKTDAGTSMACPMVAGSIALWLEAKPDLTHEEIIDIFAETCTQPDPSLSYPNNLYGYGQIDTYAGLLKILNIDRIKGVSKEQARGVKFTIGEGHIDLEWDTALTSPTVLRLYSTVGILLRSLRVHEGTTRASLSTTGLSGVVVMEVEGNGSSLLRLKN